MYPVPTPSDKDQVFLVVDDQFNFRRMITNFLRSYGFNRAIEAPDGLKAWELLELRPVDFIICDWNMPVLGGLGRLRRVRSSPDHRHLPFLMITAEMAEEVVAEAVEQGVDGYVVKPFQPKTLLEHLEDIRRARTCPDPIHLSSQTGAGFAGGGPGRVGPGPPAPGPVQLSGRPGDLAQFPQGSRPPGPARPGPGPFAVHGLGKPPESHSSAPIGLPALHLGRPGGALRAWGLAQEAARSFQRAIRLDPAKIHVYNRMGIAYRRQGRHDLAMREYLRALEINPKDPNLHFNLAVARDEAGRMIEARRSLERALSLQPEFLEARRLLESLGQT